jgi:predicted ArsR family transcriptional regulator
VDALDAIGNRHLRAALLYVRGSSGAVTADEAAGALGVHRTVARRRLERLAHAGLLETRFERRGGRRGPGAGRPAKLYAVAPESQPLEFPQRRFATLVARLLDELPADRRPQVLRRVGEGFGRDLARASELHPSGTLATGLESVCSAVRSLGFQASLERVDGDTAVISTPTCPLRPLVLERLEAAEIDRGMWAALVEQGVGHALAEDISCETHTCLETGEACSVILQLRPAEKPSTRRRRGFLSSVAAGVSGRFAT